MAGRVDVSMKQMEVPGPQAPLDDAAGEAGVEELVAGDDPVLPGCQLRKGFFALGEALPPLLPQT
ncbi:MAG TPA: hypothetical protein VFY04_07585 [Solirubrobacterales bacterium]|nr:hypothetical protein [Solirubrobacterales bacterium]